MAYSKGKNYKEEKQVTRVLGKQSKQEKQVVGEAGGSINPKDREEAT